MFLQQQKSKVLLIIYIHLPLTLHQAVGDGLCYGGLGYREVCGGGIPQLSQMVTGDPWEGCGVEMRVRRRDKGGGGSSFIG